MQTVLRIADALEWPCRMVARIIGWMLMLLMAVIIYDVVGRRFFATGSFLLQELQWHLHGAIALLGFGWAYVNNAHVRIDILSRNLTRRTRLKVEMAAILLCLLPFMALLLWYGAEFAHRSYIRGESSPSGLGLDHRWVIKSVIPLAAVVTMSGGLSVLLRAVVALRRPDLLADAWKEPERA